MPYSDCNDLLYGFITGTSSGTIGTQTSHVHNGGVAPKFYLILPKGNGVVYEGAVPDGTNLYIKASAASISFTAILFY